MSPTGISAMNERTDQGALLRQLLTEAQRQAVEIPEGKTERVYLVAKKDGLLVGYARLFENRWRLDAAVKVAALDGVTLTVSASR